MRTCWYLSIFIALSILASGSNFINAVTKKQAKKKQAKLISKETQPQVDEEEIQARIDKAIQDALEKEREAVKKAKEEKKAAKEARIKDEEDAKIKLEEDAKKLQIDPENFKNFLSPNLFNTPNEDGTYRKKEDYFIICNTTNYSISFGLSNFYGSPSDWDQNYAYRDHIVIRGKKVKRLYNHRPHVQPYLLGPVVNKYGTASFVAFLVKSFIGRSEAFRASPMMNDFFLSSSKTILYRMASPQFDLHGALISIVEEDGRFKFYLYKDGSITTLAEAPK